MGCINVKVYLGCQEVKASVRLGCKLHDDVYIKVTPTEIEIPVDGSAVEVQVYSNTSFKVY